MDRGLLTEETLAVETTLDVVDSGNKSALVAVLGISLAGFETLTRLG